MITIHNKQRRIPIDISTLQTTIQKILDILKYSDFDIGILLTTNNQIRTYNRTYRNKDTPTDILSFSYYPDLKPGKRIKAVTEDDKNLGDLILSPEYIKKDAQARGVSFEDRLETLIIHGICHLLGYDHETDQDWRSMRAKEAFILKKINAH